MLELHPRECYKQTCIPQLHLQSVSSMEVGGTLHAMDACWGTAGGVTVLVTWRSGLYAHEIDLLSSATSYIHQVHHLMGYFSVCLTLWLGMSKIKQARNGEFFVLDVPLSWIPSLQGLSYTPRTVSQKVHVSFTLYSMAMLQDCMGPFMSLPLRGEGYQ